jgi:low temperature requirement protein LtrA
MIHDKSSVPIISPDDQKVTFVELFFDLVFVFCVTQVVTLLHGHLDLRAGFSALLVFWLVWWAWTQFTWALNAANTEHPRIEFITLLATAIAFFLAVGIPNALTTGHLWFAGSYVALRVVGLLAYYWVARGDPDQRKAVIVFSLFSTTGLAAVLAGGWLGGTALYWFWAAAIALDIVAAGVGGQLEGWNLHPAHFAERHGLIVIIALGETLIVAAAGLVDTPRAAISLTTATLAVAVTGALWWSYFNLARRSLEHALESRTGGARSSLARDVFSIVHFPMLCGVIAVAVAIEAALAHPERALTADLRVALGGGAALFVCGTAAAVWRATGHALPWRWAIAPATAGILYALGSLPWVAMSILVLSLAGIAVIEHSRRITAGGVEHWGPRT